MLYLKNIELAKKYHISLGTVRNWIEAANSGKIDLILYSEEGKQYIANTDTNAAVIEKLVAANRKYRNSRSSKVLEPDPTFYEVFTNEEIYDIVRNLEIHHELPRQYNYFDGGADEWNSYTNELITEKNPNLLRRTIELLSENQSYIDSLIAKYKKVNIIDIGAGNALPVRGFLERLKNSGKLNQYIAIDISKNMLDIATNNIKDWFGDSVKCQGHKLDITSERFAKILAEDYLSKEAHDSINIVMFLGGTPDNFRNPDDAFRSINNSMNRNDILVYVNKLESEAMRPQWFDYTLTKAKVKINPMHRVVFDLLNIDEDLYDVEMGFDREKRQRYSKTRFNVALTLRFNFEDGERFVHFEKGDTILLWRSWQMTHSSILEQFQANGFYTLHTSQSEDKEYILTISTVMSREE